MKRIVIYKIVIVQIFCLFLLTSSCENKRDYNNNDSKIEHQEDEIADGIYEARVTTHSGTYTVNVSVSGGEVGYVEWPNGGHMSLSGATITDRHAQGTNSRGELIEIDIN